LRFYKEIFMASYALVYKIQGDTYLSKYSDEGILIRQGDCIDDDDNVYDSLGTDKMAFVELIEQEKDEIAIKDICIATVTGETGEWAKVDGNFVATLSAPINATDRTIAFTDASGLRDGQVVMVDTNENIQLGTKSGNSFTGSNRGWNQGHSTLTAGASHSAGAPVIPVDPVIAVNGSYVWFRDFEVTNSSTNRISVWQERGPGIDTNAVGTHIINMVIHDTGHPGIGFWEGVGDGGEVYGSLVWGSGSVATKLPSTLAHSPGAERIVTGEEELPPILTLYLPT
jgi:hypothetical protein